MKGFYRSKYTTPTGDTRYAAVTQFEVWAVFSFGGMSFLTQDLHLQETKAQFPSFNSTH